MDLTQILKNCPYGMELDCTEYDGVVKFDGFNKNNPYIIRISVMYDGEITIHNLTKYGQTSVCSYNKCVIFPKGKTTWEGFVPPCKFKDGDVLYCNVNDNGDNDDYYKYVFILKEIIEDRVIAHCFINVDRFIPTETFLVDNIYPIRLASEEEKQKLFKVIKDEGYRWNEETKTLEKLIVPKFKIGDKIVKRNSISNSWIISSVSSEYYVLKLLNGSEGIGVLTVSEQDDWELVPNKFDITTLKPFDKVLVRNKDNKPWLCDFFGFISKDYQDITTFVCVGHYAKQCIPYGGNEHLLNKTTDCDKYYKNWK